MRIIKIEKLSYYNSCNDKNLQKIQSEFLIMSSVIPIIYQTCTEIERKVTEKL